MDTSKLTSRRATAHSHPHAAAKIEARSTHADLPSGSRVRATKRTIGSESSRQQAPAADGIGRSALRPVPLSSLPPMPKFHFRRYQAEVSAALTRGSFVTPDQIQTLQAGGFNAIVNLRGEANTDQAAAEKLGLDYLHVSLPDDSVPSLEQIKTFLDFMTAPRKKGQPPLKAFIHCTAGVGRTGIFVAAYRMAIEGMAPKAALAEALKYQLHIPEQAAFILELGEAIRAGKISGYGPKARDKAAKAV
jgi:hypothetical protein